MPLLATQVSAGERNSHVKRVRIRPASSSRALDKGSHIFSGINAKPGLETAQGSKVPALAWDSARTTPAPIGFDGALCPSSGPAGMYIQTVIGNRARIRGPIVPSVRGDDGDVAVMKVEK